MNILFHLLPKEKVAYINENSTLRQAMEKMEFHRYTAVPIISDEGKYVGVLREGDILWYIKNLEKFEIQLAEKVTIKELPRKKDHNEVSINTDMERLVELSIDQNFIPVVDDRGNFIGIVTRKSIITYLANGKGENK
ncbi:CBS domain-containing protein [Haploplasma axanthum]|uniref:CBS domain-containing protein n=1 Tax=Haploplasma axanthum TaxID=29552 RepID=UPI0004046697|nr:CBS domain-containing protein [Haploplasma axanthum]